MKSTEWKNIIGYEDYYQISSSGKVQHVKRPGKYLSTTLSKKNNTKRLYLQKNNIRRCFFIHTLVATHFLGYIPLGNKSGDSLVINFKDGNRLNCNMANLEIITSYECSKISLNKRKYKPIR